MHFVSSAYSINLMLWFLNGVGPSVGWIRVHGSVASIIDITSGGMHSTNDNFSISYSNGEVFLTSKNHNTWSATLLSGNM